MRRAGYSVDGAGALLIFLLSTCCVAALSGAAGEGLPAAPVAARDSAAQLPRVASLSKLDELYRQGNEQIFNLDYDEALATFDEALSVAPEHPAPYAWKALTLWMKELFRRGEFDLGRYLDMSRFRSGKKGSAEERSALTKQVLDLVDRGLERTSTLSADPERAVEAKYYHGVLRGIRAGYRTTVLHQFMSAIGDSKGAVSDHREVLKADPSWVDAEYGLGTYNFVTGTMPWFAKFFGLFVGIHGNTERGIEQIEHVAAEGSRLKDSALVTLTVVYVRNDQPLRAAEILTGLAERFPRNFYFLQNLAFVLERAKEWDRSLEVYEELLDRVAAGVPNFDRADAQRLHLAWGGAALKAGRGEAASRAYGWVLERDDSPASAVTLAHLGRGQAFDLLGNREAAIADYRSVLEAADVQKAHKSAKRYLRKPYTVS
ncbi:MAG: tetratricopeptide repeat protein [Acidobacteriota bacterium]